MEEVRFRIRDFIRVKFIRVVIGKGGGGGGGGFFFFFLEGGINDTAHNLRPIIKLAMIKDGDVRGSRKGKKINRFGNYFRFTLVKGKFFLNSLNSLNNERNSNEGPIQRNKSS